MRRFAIPALLTTLTLSAALPAREARACGGFFCSTTPIDQSAERVVFAVDDEDGTVTTHVQINYQGSAEQFAWIVPVASIPELFVSTEELFQQLEYRTRASFYTIYKEEGTCTYDGWGPGGCFDCDYAMGADGDAVPSAPEDDGGVVVIAQSQVGPYETVVLLADEAEPLLDWLQENGYDLPDSLSSALAPYIAVESYFVALRLQNDKSTGDIAPLGMKYKARAAGIPIQLTSIAATPDMRVVVWVLGGTRAVPDNYLHVQINEAAIDWLGYGQNYEEVITLAANEAGGRAFATDFAGPTDTPDRSFLDMLWWDDRFDLDALASIEDPAAFLDALLMQGFPRTPTMQNLIRTHIPMPAAAVAAGVEESWFYNCMECHAEYLTDEWLEEIDFDAQAFAIDLDVYIVEPLIAADTLFHDFPYLTRMTSSVSPEEMTEDPAFLFNPDLADVANQRTADLVYMCGDGLNWYEAPRRIVLQDGRTILLPPQQWFYDAGTSEGDYLDALGAPAAAVVEDMTSSGPGTILVDRSILIDDELDDHNRRAQRDIDDAGGCACRSNVPLDAAAGLPLLAMVLVLGFMQRRRRPQ